MFEKFSTMQAAADTIASVCIIVIFFVMIPQIILL
jgi:hypothetical protein